MPRYHGARPVYPEFDMQEILRMTGNLSSRNLISMGGFGMVYRGKLSCGTCCAVKQSLDRSANALSCFRTELHFLSRVHHPRIVTLLGFARARNGRKRWLVFELLECSLDHMIDHDADFLWLSRLNISVDIAEGLTYLWSFTPHPIVHRDVKTANILINERRAKVGDFGFAIEDAPGNVNVIMGTPGYMDPTACRASVESDMYSLGVVLCELLTSWAPFNGDDQPIRESEKMVIAITFTIHDDDLTSASGGQSPVLASRLCQPIASLGNPRAWQGCGCDLVLTLVDMALSLVRHQIHETAQCIGVLSDLQERAILNTSLTRTYLAMNRISGDTIAEFDRSARLVSL